MAVMSLWHRVDGEIVALWSLDNYREFFTKPHLLKALINSIEISATVTIISIVLAYPLAWIIAYRVPERWQRMALVIALLDILCGALLFLAAGSGKARSCQ